MQKIILLDLDGTIGDTKFGVLEAVKYALRKIDFRELSDSELNEFIGPPIFEALIDAGVNESEVSRAVDEYRYAYTQNVIEVNNENIKRISDKLLKTGVKIGDLVPGLYFSIPFDGIVNMMQELSMSAKANNWTIITGTSKPELWARIIINNFGIENCFTPIHHQNQLQSGKLEDMASENAHIYLDYEGANEQKLIVKDENDGIFGASMDKSRTSKQEVLEYALKSVNYSDFSNDKAILVGDRKHDIIGAHNINIPVIGCEWGYALDGELDRADYVINKPNELVSVLQNYFA